MKIIDKLNEIHGKVVKRFVILGFPIFSLTQTNAEHFNLYVCCVPLFRINKKGKVCNVHILPHLRCNKLKLFYHVFGEKCGRM